MTHGTLFKIREVIRVALRARQSVASASNFWLEVWLGNPF
jgi:hypothetical protein